MRRLKNFNVKLKVETIYTINVDAIHAQEAADAALEDYEVGNQGERECPDETHWIEEVKEVKKLGLTIVKK